jgi:hypothetical protein
MLLFESFNEIKVLCQKYRIENYTINPDGTIDVDGDVDLYDLGLSKLPLKFREVTGDFYCTNNELTTLEGAPQSVDGYFDCVNNRLTTLKSAPQSVGGSFYCYFNSLTTLEGAPQYVGGNFDCYNNCLTTLEGAPKFVENDFDCSVNELTTLVSAPKSVGGNFYCKDNTLDPIRELFPNDKTFHKLCMEWEFFAGGNKIYKHKFLEAMLDIRKELPESIPGYEYI